MTDDTTIIVNDLQPEETEALTRIALLVEYCGTGFHGSQYQKNLPTVQLAVQEALNALKLPVSTVTFASRTDAGVHAHGQVGHFDIAPSALVNIKNIAGALNAALPDDVAVRAAHLDTGRQFHSRREARAKWYRYTIYNAPQRSVWARQGVAAHYAKPLDVDAMQEAANLLLGCHNFKSFKDSDSLVTNDMCRIQHVQVARDGDFINFDIAADRFLYKMVRNLAGQLIEIGSFKRSLAPESILDVMAAQDRTRAAATAKPEGLALMAILYSPPFNFFDEDVYVQQIKNILKQMESPHHENLFRKAS